MGFCSADSNKYFFTDGKVIVREKTVKRGERKFADCVLILQAEYSDCDQPEDRDVFGGLYEKILKDLQSAGNAGEYYTPRADTQFMVDMRNSKLGETVLILPAEPAVS